MDIKRKHATRRLQDSVNALRYSRKLDEEKLKVLKSQSNSSFVSSQISKLQDSLKQKEEDIFNLEENIRDILGGKFDSKIIADYNTKAQEAQERLDHKRMKDIESSKEKEILKQRSKQYHAMSCGSDRESRYKKKDMDKAYYNYVKSVNMLPEYISKQLDKMPNNKGYIFRGVYHYGRNSKTKHINSNVLTMFEDKKGMKLTHEWNTNTMMYKRYEKRTREDRMLKLQHPIKKKQLGNDLMEYLV